MCQFVMVLYWDDMSLGFFKMGLLCMCFCAPAVSLKGQRGFLVLSIVYNYI